MNNILKSMGLDDSNVLRKVISDSFFIDMGIIKEIKEDNEIVTVEMSSASSTADITIVDCVLVCPSSKSISVNIRPTVNDKVIVLFPRRFASEMFNLEKQEPVVSEGVSSYSCMGGIAFLFNQFQEGYKNYISFDNGKVDIKLAYDKDNDKNLLSIVTDENGAVTLTNDKATVALDNNGYLAYERKENNTVKSKLVFTSSGFSMQDENNCTIESSKEETESKVVINGHLTVKL